MKQKSKIFFSTFIFFGISSIALAADQQGFGGGQGLSISPFVLERQMEKGQSLRETIEVTNTTNRTLPIDIVVKDFAPDGTEGQQTFFDPGEGDENFSLARWIHIQNNPSLVLRAGEKTQVDFTIDAPLNADEGGHYGAVIFSFQNETPQAGTAVQVSQKIGAIILVKLGQAKEDGFISRFETDKNIYNKTPITFTTTFRNTGNVHVKPRGAISVRNMFGKKVASILVNENANNVIPNSDRLFQSTWQTKTAFGRYTAEEELVYGNSGSVVHGRVRFWVMPWKPIVAVAAILLVIIIGFFYALRRYNRWFAKQLLDNKPTKKRVR